MKLSVTQCTSWTIWKLDAIAWNNDFLLTKIPKWDWLTETQLFIGIRMECWVNDTQLWFVLGRCHVKKYRYVQYDNLSISVVTVTILWKDIVWEAGRIKVAMAWGQMFCDDLTDQQYQFWYYSYIVCVGTIVCLCFASQKTIDLRPWDCVFRAFEIFIFTRAHGFEWLTTDWQFVQGTFPSSDICYEEDSLDQLFFRCHSFVWQLARGTFHSSGIYYEEDFLRLIFCWHTFDWRFVQGTFTSAGIYYEKDSLQVFIDFYRPFTRCFGFCSLFDSKVSLRLCTSNVWCKKTFSKENEKRRLYIRTLTILMSKLKAPIL